MADESRIAQLVFRKLRGEILYHEQEELDQWLKEDVANQALLDEYTREGGLLAELWRMDQMDEAVAMGYFEARKEEDVDEDREAVGEQGDEGTGPGRIEESRRGIVRRLLPYAAAILFGFVGGIWYLLDHKASTQKTEAPIAQVKAVADVNGITPSENRAMLLLADRTVIQLDTLAVGSRLADDPAVWKKDSNTIVLGQSSGATVSVPARAMYHVVLPDGTKTVLNAGSTLRWTAAYNGGQRMVELEGEGYFDVAKDEAHPFRVRTNRWEVEALGTAFDVRDYRNEPRQQAVLQSGKLIVQDKDKKSVTLLPHQSAVTNNDQSGIQVNEHADVETLLAWKRGYFNFDKRDMREAIQHIAQWYGVSVSFAKDLQGGTLGVGDMQRDLPLGILLKDLELPHLHFVLRNDTIIVKQDR